MSRTIKIMAAVICYEVQHAKVPMTDLSDLGNEIGIAIQSYLSDDEMGFDLDDFINGIKHGVSLMELNYGNYTQRCHNCPESVDLPKLDSPHNETKWLEAANWKSGVDTSSDSEWKVIWYCPKCSISKSNKLK